MEARPSLIKRERMGDVEIISMPYLHGDINPADMDFNEDNPGKSLVKPGKSRLESLSDGRQLLFYIKLGEGGYGDVWLAQDVESKNFVAVKIAHENVSVTKFNEEAKALKESRNLLHADFDTKAIVMKLLPGMSVFDAFCNRKISQQKPAYLQKLVVAKAILKKIAALHKDEEAIKQGRRAREKKLHLDIKTENIIVDAASHRVSFCDYGFVQKIPGVNRSESAKIIPVDDEKKSPQEKVAATEGEVRSEVLRGTLEVVAPELFLGLVNHAPEFAHNEATEVYSLGIALIELFGLAKQHKVSLGAAKGVIGRYILDPDAAKKADSDLCSLLQSMTTENPADRPTVIQAYKRFNQIFNREAKVAGINVGVISLAEFKKMDQQKRNAMIAAILSLGINAIVFADDVNDHIAMKDYYDARYQLMHKGIINIALLMVRGSTEEERLRAVKSHYDSELATINTQLFSYHNDEFTMTTPVIDYTYKNSVTDDTQRLRSHPDKSRSVADIDNQHYFVNLRDAVQESVNAIDHITNSQIGYNTLSAKYNFRTQDQFIDFVKLLEKYYKHSLKEITPLFGKRITEAGLNAASDSVCMKQRALGVLLQACYKILKYDMPDKGFQEACPNVMNLNVPENYLAISHAFNDIRRFQRKNVP